MIGTIRSTYDYLAEERDAARAGKKHTPEQVAEILDAAMDEIAESRASHNSDYRELSYENDRLRPDAEAFRALRSALAEGGAS